MTMEIQSAKIYIGGGSIGPEALSASSSGCSAEDTLTLRRCGLPSPNNDLFFLSIVGADDRRSIFLRGHNLIELARQCLNLSHEAAVGCDESEGWE